MKHRVIEYQANLILEGIIEIQDEYKIPYENMLPILRRIIQMTEAPRELIECKIIPFPVNRSIDH